LVELYDCLIDEMKAAYGKSDNEIATSYQSWRRFSAQPYESATHGGRYVQNYAGGKGAAQYATFENGGAMPAGSQLAKDSFAVAANGQASVGPLFIMEKMRAGFNADTADWKYTMIMPNGSLFGTTGGAGSDKVQFCADCHSAGPRDAMFFLPEEYRAK
jgi:hypothetical protein